MIDMNNNGKEIYEVYKDRLSNPAKPIKLTEKEIEELKKRGRI